MPGTLTAALALLQIHLIELDNLEGWSGVYVSVTLFVLYVVVMWRVFEKGGEQPWIGPIPVVNMFFLARIAGMPRHVGFLLMIPLVGTVVWFLLCLALAQRFGRGRLFGIGLALLPVIFFPELAFGRSELIPDRAPRFWGEPAPSSSGD